MDVRRGTRVLGILAPAGAGLVGLIRDAIALREAGADVVDLDALPGGAFAEADADTIALLVRGLSEAGVPTSVATTSAEVAANAIEHGVGWILDPSAGSDDPAMRGVVAASRAGWIIGPWSPHGARGAGGEVAERYAEGLVRNIAGLLDAGVRPDRIVLDAGVGVSAADPEPWRMLNSLDRIAALGYPVLVDASEDTLAAVSSDDAEDRLEDAAVGLAVLAAGHAAWGVRTRRVGRVAGVVQRIAEPRQAV